MDIGEWVASVGDGWCLDASCAETSESGRWANHRLLPNSKLYALVDSRDEFLLRPHDKCTHFLNLVALSDIDIGEEIFVDYGTGYWSRGKYLLRYYWYGLPELIELL